MSSPRFLQSQANAYPSLLNRLTPLLLLASLAGLACSSSDDSGGGGGSANLGPDGSARPDDGTGFDSEAQAFECDVLRLVNQRRAAGANCGGEGSFSPTWPLVMNARLRTAARKHATDMATRDYFKHDTPEGVEFSQRITSEGYEWWTAGENIAHGQRTTESVMNDWMGSDGHCSNIMGPDFEDIGIGYDGTYWVQDFAATR